MADEQELFNQLGGKISVDELKLLLERRKAVAEVRPDVPPDKTPGEDARNASMRAFREANAAAARQQIAQAHGLDPTWQDRRKRLVDRVDRLQNDLHAILSELQAIKVHFEQL